MYDVMGIGCHAIDYLCMLDSYPEEDTKIKSDSIEVQGGGNIATALVAVARLGGDAFYHGIVADDAHRERIISGLARDGVETSFISVREGKCPFAFIIINRSNSSRTILYSLKDAPRFLPEDINRELFGRCRVLLVDFYFPEASLEAVRIASRLNLPVVMDAEKPCPLADRIMSYGTHIISSLGFARSYTGCGPDASPDDMLSTFAGLQPAPFISITLGEKGVICFDREGGRILRQDAYRIDAVDTTGAGDVFHGAYAFFLARGFPVEECLRLSSACSAMKCRSVGGRVGIPKIEELYGFLKSRGEAVPDN